MSFRLGQPEYVRLSVIDASGRTIRNLHEGMMLAGSHDASWDGRSDRSGDVPAGIYFVRLQTSQGVKLQRLAVMR
jgi:flagellar hook assembly protein FlgD